MSFSYLHQLIGYKKSTFIKGGSIHGNIFNATKLVHSILLSKCKISYILLKLDLETISNSLHLMNFTSKFIN